MGRADILANYDEGHYLIRVQRNEDPLRAQLARIADKLESIQEQRDELQEAIDEAQDTLDEILVRADEILEELSDSSATQEHLDDLRQQYVETMQEAYEASVEIDKLNAEAGYMDLDLASLTARQNKLNDLQGDISSDVRTAWCVDYTPDLDADEQTMVDTIEIPGTPEHVLIAPQQRETGENLPAGMLAPILPMTPAQAAFNWAILPGWQKWKPTYRTGIISNIDTEDDTCNVSIDEAWSYAQGLHINQDATLTGIPVEYMDCNAAAFEEGDRVVVEFAAQDWAQPRVVGFVSEPSPCGLARFAVRIGAAHPTFFYDTEKGFVFVNADCADYLNRCASKLILKDTDVVGEQIEYLVTQDSTTVGRVRIYMDGTEEVDMPSVSPPGDSLHYPVSGFIYNNDYVYMHTRLGTTQWKYTSNTNDKGCGLMYELKGNSLEPPEWRFTDFGSYPEVEDNVPRTLVTGTNQRLIVYWYDGECTGIHACYESFDGDYCTIFNSVGKSSFRKMGYPSERGKIDPYPLAITSEGTAIEIAREKPYDTQRDIISYAEDACVYDPWLEVEEPHSIFQGWAATARPALEYTMHIVDKSYVFESHAVEKVVFALNVDAVAPVNSTWHVDNSLPAVGTRKMTMTESNESFVSNVSVTGNPSGESKGKETEVSAWTFNLGDNSFNLGTWQRTWEGYVESVPGGFDTGEQSAIISAGHLYPEYVFFSGDVPVLAELLVWEHGEGSSNNEDYKSVFYDNTLHPVQSITKVACHDMRQEGQPKLVAFYADTGWKIYIENDAGTPTDVTTDFFTKLNAFLGTAYTPADADVEMFFIRR